MKNIKGIIFDFNGVLFLDSHLHERAWREYSKIVRGSEFSDEEMYSYMHGRTNKDIIEYLIKTEVSSFALAKHTEGKESVYRKMCTALGKDLVLSPGAIELLDYLKINNIPRTIATSSEINNLKFFWNVFNLKNWFNFDFITYDDGKIKGKPEPDLYLLASKKIGLDPSECLVVEDSISGIEAAKNAGVGFIVAIGPKNQHDKFSSLKGVSLKIEDLRELIDYLRRTNG